ncbi:MAG: glycosyltransferase, partial [Candidatus Bathyarchaeota archaeon]
VFIFPSLAEGWGIAPVEGLACHLPVVCYGLDVLKENLRHGAVFVPFRDFDTFAEETIKLLSNEDYRTELGGAGRKLAEEYSWDRIAERELEILQKVVDG